jgi:hypothetical protein
MRSRGRRKSKGALCYFEQSDALGAVLDHVFRCAARAGDAGARKQPPPRQKMLEYLGAYFDYIAATVVSCVVQRSDAVRRRQRTDAKAAKEYFRPPSGSWPI